MESLLFIVRNKVAVGKRLFLLDLFSGMPLREQGAKEPSGLW